MNAYELLRWVLLVEALVVLPAVVLMFGHGLWMTAYERRAVPLLERGRAVLADLAVSPRVSPADREALRRLPRRLQIRLFTELASSVGGSHRTHLTALAREIGLVQAAERLCADRRWWKRLRGVRLLTALGGGEAVVPALFRDPHPAVRAEAVEWAGDHPE
ncbi:MAG TPA: hypothetical protein VFX98_01870, partial [Longimicrobiaceae bacterium]|nr:hypothetical protein [Longimicrobiaceae bacterium]